ncbi:MAG: glycosyltransferase family 39 protein [Planctomycetes bacterium]|nr:glycosyltransferase family 39 protein [Planctomycetota bacterium]
MTDIPPDQTSPEQMTPAVSPGPRNANTAAAQAMRKPIAPATIGWLIALLGWTSLLAFYHLDGGASFEPTDCWVAQTAREMSEGDSWQDFVVSRFCGEKRMQKSPGPYWAVVLTSFLRGTPVDESSTRLPNGIAAVLLVATIFWLTRHIAGDRAAIFAGFAASSSVLILYWSHRGASDLGLTTFIAISLACLWVAANTEPPGWKRNVLWLLGYFAAGLGMLYKMPMPLACIGAPAFFYLLLRNRWRVLANRWHLLGLAVFLLAWLPWAIAVLLAEPTALDKWRVEFFDRFTGNLPNVQHQKQWFFYFIYLLPPLVYCVPYTLSLPRAFVRAFRKQPGVNRDGMLFMLIWFFSLLAFFTAATGKELRYFLPALPPLFVMLGVELAHFFDPQRPANPKLERRGAWAVWILVPVGFAIGVFVLRQWYEREAALGMFAWNELWPSYVVTAAIFAGGAALSAWLYRRRHTNAAFGALVATMYLTWLWMWPNLMPTLISQQPFRDFAAQLRENIPSTEQGQLRQIAHQDPRIIWYSDYRFPRIIDQLELLRRQGGRRSLEYETRTVGEEMALQLAGEQRVLFVASRPHYLDFLIKAPPELAQEGRAMPPTYLWFQTRVGPKLKHYVVFGNRPPPWDEPALKPPSERLEAARQALRNTTLTTRPAQTTSEPTTSRPADDG